MFNLADAAIVAGVVGLLYEFLCNGSAPQKRPDPPGWMAEVASSGAAKVARYRGIEPAGRMIAMRNDDPEQACARLLMACACGALLALRRRAACAQQAQADDEDTFEQKIIKNILGGMGVDVGRPGIDYRERSPLVIPPTLDLPPPQAAGTAASNPAWPREAGAARSSCETTRTSARRPTSRVANSALTPDELRRGINPRAPRVTDPSQTPARSSEANIGRPMRPAELNNKGIFNWSALMGTAPERAGQVRAASRSAAR